MKTFMPITKLNYKISGLIYSFTALFIFLILSVSTHASERYWVGGTSNLWNNTNNWSTSSGGTGGAGVPTVNDTAYFDGNSTQSCIVDAAVVLNYLRIESGFSDTLFQNKKTISISLKGFYQNGGTIVIDTTLSTAYGWHYESGNLITECMLSA